ncbi:armadillo-type protein [Geopyxis carbonaria]|nr:armadillo-type protein [Geopyxis carbonaria]
MSLTTSNVLAELHTNIRTRPVPWEAYVRSNIVTDADVKKIKAIDKVPRDKRADIVNKDGQGYARLVLGSDGVLQNSVTKSRGDIIQYMLMWTGDLLSDVPGFAHSLLALPKPYDLLISLLRGHDAPVPLLASAVLTTLLSTALTSSSKVGEDVKDALPKFYHYLCGVSRGGDHHEQDLAIQSYVSLLRTSYARTTFWYMREETANPLYRILHEAAHGSGSSNVGNDRNALGGSNIVQGGVPLQLLYHVLLTVWELTFEESVAEDLNQRYDDLIPAITDILRSSIKEKITRVCLALLANLATKSPSTNLPALLLTGILPHLQTLSTRFNSDSDPDLTADLSTLIAALEAFESEQTTLSSYKLEVMATHLRWSPPHRNEAFWKKHAREILDDKELVHALAKALATSVDKTVLAVAANDVGVLVREVPYARKRWEELGVKARVMELMGDTDAEVRYEALKAVQGFLQTAFSG